MARTRWTTPSAHEQDGDGARHPAADPPLVNSKPVVWPLGRFLPPRAGGQPFLSSPLAPQLPDPMESDSHQAAHMRSPSSLDGKGRPPRKGSPCWSRRAGEASGVVTGPESRAG